MNQIRVTRVTYGPSAEPLVDILVQLYQWSVERRRAAQIDCVDDTQSPPQTAASSDCPGDGGVAR